MTIGCQYFMFIARHLSHSRPFHFSPLQSGTECVRDHEVIKQKQKIFMTREALGRVSNVSMDVPSRNRGESVSSIKAKWKFMLLTSIQ